MQNILLLITPQIIGLPLKWVHGQLSQSLDTKDYATFALTM